MGLARVWSSPSACGGECTGEATTMCSSVHSVRSRPLVAVAQPRSSTTERRLFVAIRLADHVACRCR